ncbi:MULTISPECIES: flagellar hook-basal body complex protein FliE [Heyndrickxia]|uniref:Flagellar hook-basal body complex protein FliE n=1 Tax=Heyndrickxia coagulans DSM 1 = ATCC 7050 TaxID=1121088 RepID=A0A8B4BSK9_HEYCO|nr:flagellar hook-basal body complex protein FliE [Heyndrickxia coagulans]AJH78721.1 flagellar hook-basal body complex protein FliE [Heyndrickxia coagulans DSM 1 = ATCC 7050]MCR2845280.1 flagellar hook-basal body complex protein FliE [Heyndrickxia coagulans]MDR4222981.1 flagellar hook-basal body complex protein FliE [Heyndrickxia coagulans DSM 1 = ATCC 7050]MEC5267676.1 flagellar hook-basal body complex protein FliE [Heyndrickxia coagulans]MED4345469.1 flagellar hook-basal body complex protein
MAIQQISQMPSASFSGLSPKPAGTAPSANGSVSFSDLLKQSVNELNKQQNNSDNMITKLSNGENVDLYQVMVAVQKANLSMQAALEVRNKAVEGYKEMMQMQV